MHGGMQPRGGYSGGAGMAQPPVQTIAPPTSIPFSFFVEQCNLVKQAPLAELSGKKIAVDGCKLIESINDTMRRQEPLAPLTNPVPYVAYTEMSSLVSTFASYNITPDYCFSGMGLIINPKDKEVPKQRDHNQTILTLVGKPADPMRFQKAGEEVGAVLDEDGENYVFLYMKLYPNFTVTRAPYWSWAQIASYFSPNVKYVDYVYGCYEMLAFRGIDRVITRFDETSYYYVTKSDLLAVLHQYNPSANFTENDLPYVISAMSCHKQLNDPHFTIGNPMDFVTRVQRDRNTNVLVHPSGKGSPADARAARGSWAIQFCPVLTANAECIPLSQMFGIGAPKRVVKQLFGSPLPPLFYYLQMAGVLSPGILSTVATKQIVDGPAVVDSAEFRQVAEFIIPLRTQIVYQLVQSMQPQVPMDITWIRRYNPSGSGREMPILQPPQIKLDEWNTENFRVLPEFQGRVFFTDVLVLSQNAVSAAAYHNSEQALAAVLLKALDLLGYFTHAMQTNSTEVSGASVYSTALECCLSPSLSEYAVLLIELIRTKTLNDKLLTTQSRNSALAQMNNPILFASRLLSIIPVRTSGIWGRSGIISADLCGFNGMARSLQRTLRSLCEVISVVTLCDAITSNRCHFTAEQYQKEIQPKLPFSTPLMCCGGLIAQYILDNPDPRLTLDRLKDVFPECSYLAEDLSSMFYFWYYAGRIIAILHEEDQEALRQTYMMYQAANATISKMAVQLLGPLYEFMRS